MCSRELRKIRFLYNSPQILQAEQNPVLNNMAVHPTWKKRKLKCREDSFFSLSSPSLLPETMKMVT